MAWHQREAPAVQKRDDLDGGGGAYATREGEQARRWAELEATLREARRRKDEKSEPTDDEES